MVSGSVCGLSLVLVSEGYTLRCSARASHLQRLLLLRSTGSRAHRLQWLWLAGLVALAAPVHVGYSGTRYQTHVLYIGWQIFNHGTTREVPSHISVLRTSGAQDWDDRTHIISSHLRGLCFITFIFRLQSHSPSCSTGKVCKSISCPFRSIIWKHMNLWLSNFTPKIYLREKLVPSQGTMHLSADHRVIWEKQRDASHYVYH